MRMAHLDVSDWSYLRDLFPSRDVSKRYAGTHVLHGLPTNLNDESLPLFRWGEVVNQHRRYVCPYCGSAVTFSQYGTAHRWGWCVHCDDGRTLPEKFESHLSVLPSSHIRHLLFSEMKLSTFEFGPSFPLVALSIVLSRKSRGLYKR